MHCFPIVGRDHFNRIPWAAVKKRTVRPFARTLLTPDTKIRIDFDATEGGVVFIRNPEHAGVDRTVFDAGRRAGATSAAVSRDREDPRLLLARSFAVTN